MVRDRAFGQGDFVVDGGVEDLGASGCRSHHGDGTPTVQVERRGDAHFLEEGNGFGDRQSFAIPGLFAVDDDQPELLARGVGADDRPGVGFIRVCRSG